MLMEGSENSTSLEKALEQRIPIDAPFPERLMI